MGRPYCLVKARLVETSFINSLTVEDDGNAYPGKDYGSRTKL